jgi:hypothetical protein
MRYVTDLRQFLVWNFKETYGDLPNSPRCA